MVDDQIVIGLVFDPLILDALWYVEVEPDGDDCDEVNNRYESH